jgi:hypothetical protein
MLRTLPKLANAVFGFYEKNRQLSSNMGAAYLRISAIATKNSQGQLYNVVFYLFKQNKLRIKKYDRNSV